MFLSLYYQTFATVPSYSYLSDFRFQFPLTFLIEKWIWLHVPVTCSLKLGESSMIFFPVSCHLLIEQSIFPPPCSSHFRIQVGDSSLISFPVASVLSLSYYIIIAPCCPFEVSFLYLIKTWR